MKTRSFAFGLVALATVPARAELGPLRDLAGPPPDFAGCSPDDLGCFAPPDFSVIAPPDFSGIVPPDMTGQAPMDLGAASADLAKSTDMAEPPKTGKGGCAVGAGPGSSVLALLFAPALLLLRRRRR